MIGSGPNGLTAAATVAAAGFSVLVLEAAGELGGGVKTLPLTLPGFLHDVCSAIHPLAISSPALRAMPLSQYGLEWIQPDIPVAHPLDGGGAVFLQRSLRETAANLGGDGESYQRLLSPAVQNWDLLTGDGDFLGMRSASSGSDWRRHVRRWDCWRRDSAALRHAHYWRGWRDIRCFAWRIH